MTDVITLMDTFTFIRQMRYSLLLLFMGLVSVPGFSQTGWIVYNSQNSMLPDNTIRCLHKGTDGVIWIGTDNGIVKWENGVMIIIDSSNTNLPTNQIRSIATDSVHQLYVGTMQAGLAVYEGDSFVVYNTFNSPLPDDNVRSLVFDQNKTLWVGTVGGAVNITSEGWTVFKTGNSPIGSDNINRIFVDENNVQWIGTVNGGIARKNGNQWTVFNTTNSGLADNTVLDFASDQQGNLWFVTPAQGLGRYNGSTWLYKITTNSTIPTNSLTSLNISRNTDIKYIGSSDKGLIRWRNTLVFDSFTVVNSPMPDNHVTCLLLYDDTTLYIGTQSGGLVKYVDTMAASYLNVLHHHIETHQLYPNPTDGLLYSTKGQNFFVTIYDMMGRMMGEKIKAQGFFDLHHLPPGYYMLVLQDSYSTFRQRILIE